MVGEETAKPSSGNMIWMVLNLISPYIPDWPSWALNLLYFMSALLVVILVAVHFLSKEVDDDDEEVEELKKTTITKTGTETETKTTNRGDTTNGSSTGDGDLKDSVSTPTADHHSAKLHASFVTFRRTYIFVYSIVMLADWMQGTHMYTLYLSYNVNVSALFLTGFLSGAIFAPFLGSALDKFGRKKSCIVYCLLEILINVLEHYDTMWILLVGRVLGGISTNLLFSAFESWMTTEHRTRGYPESWLEETYAAASIGNGSMAITAGIISQLLEDQLGHIGPFQGAIALTVFALILVIIQFEENYGEEGNVHHEHHESHSSLYGQFRQGWKVTTQDSRVWRIGLTQALSEGAMYTFVFTWVPTLLSLHPPEGRLPTGCVFASFMMSITIGGVAFKPLQSLFKRTMAPIGYEAEFTATCIYWLASASMAVPAWCLSAFASAANGSDGAHCFGKVLASFVVVEMCVGLFMPVAGTLRSRYVPDSLQGAILNIFRLPLNIIVVLGTHATDVMDPCYVFMLVSSWFFGATLIQASMIGCRGSFVVKSSTKKAKAE